MFRYNPISRKYRARGEYMHFIKYIVLNIDRIFNLCDTSRFENLFSFYFRGESVGARRKIFDRRIHWLKGNEFAFIRFNSNGRWTERRRDVFCSRIILSQPRASLEIQISPFGWMMRRGSGRTRRGGGGGGGQENVSECVKLIMHSSCFRRRRR